MAYTTTQLINAAYYASGVVSREFETVSGTQISDGLQWLNDILADKDIDQAMLPYETTYTFTSEIGKKTYWIPDLIQIDTLVFYKENLRFPMYFVKRNDFFGKSRVENIQSLPYMYYFERDYGGGNLHLYFEPNRAYEFEIHGSFRIPPVKLNQDLSQNFALVDLGTYTYYTTMYFAPGQFVVNGVDLNGYYGESIGALLNTINEKVPNVRAYLNVNNVILESTNQDPVSIYLDTNGYPPNGTRFKFDVRVATTTDLVATYDNGTGLGQLASLTAVAPGAINIDGVALTLNDLVLVKDQTTQLQNGVYRVTTVGDGVTPWVLTRASNYDLPYKIQIGDIFTVQEGTVNAFDSFIQKETIIAVGTTPILFELFEALTFSNFSTIEFANRSVNNSIGIDQFYLTYLRYALANRICVEYNQAVTENIKMMLHKYENWISKRSRVLDMSIDKVSTLDCSDNRYGFAFANLWRGYFP